MLILYSLLWPQGTADVPGPTLNDFFPTYITQYLEFDDPYGPLPQKIDETKLNEKEMWLMNLEMILVSKTDQATRVRVMKLQ